MFSCCVRQYPGAVTAPVALRKQSAPFPDNMTLKNAIFFFACIFLALLSGQNAARAASDDEVPNIITNSSSNYLIHIEYPTTGHASADSAIGFWANQQANTFIRGIEDIPNAENSHFGLRITYSANRVSARCISVRFSIYLDMDDAQTGTGIATFTYDLRDGRSLALGDLFQKNRSLLPFLSIYCRKSLKERFYNASLELEKYLEEVTAPEPTNFSFFTVTGTGITMYFPMIDSMDYPLTEVAVSIPMSELKRFEPVNVYWSKNTGSRKR